MVISIRGSRSALVALGCSGPCPNTGPGWDFPRLFTNAFGAIVHDTFCAVR